MDCIALQAPLSMEFSRQEHWSGLPFPSPGDLPDPGIKPQSPALQRILYCRTTREALKQVNVHLMPCPQGLTEDRT